MTRPMRERLIARTQATIGVHVGVPLDADDISEALAWKIIEPILNELREPDEAMHDAGSAVIDQGQGHPHDKPLPTLRNAFTAMIDAVREGA